MKRLILALAATLAFAAPIAADTMTMLLPALSFPDDTVTTSTKDCVATTTPQVCPTQE